MCQEENYISSARRKYYRKCFVCGPDNPAGLHLQPQAAGGRSRVCFTPTDEMQGMSTKKGSLMHGGFTSMIFDEVMSYVTTGLEIETVTLSMTVNYTSPARTGHLMEAEAWLEERDGRKLRTAAKLTDKVTGKTVATATGLYYQIDLTAFIDGMEED